MGIMGLVVVLFMEGMQALTLMQATRNLVHNVLANIKYAVVLSKLADSRLKQVFNSVNVVDSRVRQAVSSVNVVDSRRRQVFSWLNAEDCRRNLVTRLKFKFQLRPRDVLLVNQRYAKVHLI